MAAVSTVRLVADPYPPYQYEEGDRVKGIDHDLIVAAFAEERIAVEVSLLSWEQCLEWVADGRADGVFQIQRSPERDQAFIFSQPLRAARTVFLTAGDRFRFSSALSPEETLSSHLVGVVKGYGYGSTVDDLPESAKVKVGSHEQLLRDLSAGRFDVAVADWGVAAYLSARLGITNLRRVQGHEITRVLHVAFALNSSGIARLFDQGLELVKAKGVETEILRLYNVVD